MGVYNTELFNNLGLCCFYAQQYDMALNCFERALSLATDENMADVWYNIGQVALVIISCYTYWIELPNYTPLSLSPPPPRALSTLKRIVKMKNRLSCVDFMESNIISK